MFRVTALLYQCSRQAYEVREERSKLGDYHSKQLQNRHGGRNTVAERPDAENDGGNKKSRVRNCLLSSQCLATMIPRTPLNNLPCSG